MATPRELPSSYLSINRPPWLVDAAENYQPITGSYNTETSFQRGSKGIELLDKILPEIPHSPNILLIGLGVDAEPLICCYEPFRYTAHFEGLKKDYRMTLVDVDPEVLDDLRNRTHLFIAYRQFGGNLRLNLERVWQKYLTDTDQSESVTFERVHGLKFSDYLETEGGILSYKSVLKKGVLFANIPSQFRTRINNGSIRLIQEDIAIADIQSSGLFDFVECTNVLYLLSQEGQKLALANISMSMAINGRLFINDIGGYTGTPVFTEFGGWLDSTKLKQLGLVIESVLSEKESSRSVLLKKVK